MFKVLINVSIQKAHHPTKLPKSAIYEGSNLCLKEKRPCISIENSELSIEAGKQCKYVKKTVKIKRKLQKQKEGVKSHHKTKKNTFADVG